jgi:hypothetical protein
MNDTQQTQSTPTGQAAAHARCACGELTEAISELLGFSPSVKQHLHNSRIEFLKALREMTTPGLIMCRVKLKRAQE